MIPHAGSSPSPGPPGPSWIIFVAVVVGIVLILLVLEIVVFLFCCRAGQFFHQKRVDKVKKVASCKVHNESFWLVPLSALVYEICPSHRSSNESTEVHKPRRACMTQQ